MCTHQREIKNKYTGQRLYVKCGHCPACLQEKAAYRVGRIKAQDSPDFDVIMVGLTYRRYCAPYVLRDDAFKFSRGELKKLPVYRDTHYRKVRQNAQYDIAYSRIRETRKICDVDFVNSCDFTGCRDLVHEYGKIGVSYYPDVQHFLARLRLNLKRNFNFDYAFKTYSCSEYGAGKKEGHGIYRPHFHLLFWIPKGNFQTFRNAVIESWPFGDISNRKRAVEIAYNASSYVASYVNCGSGFPKFLERYFKPKHSYSKDFGCNKDLFSLTNILSNFRGGHLTYFSQKTDKVGMPIVELPFPKYIIHRYFPLFKGYGRFTRSQILSLMPRIARLEGDEFRATARFLFEKPIIFDIDFINKIAFPVWFSDDDLYKIKVRLNNAYLRFSKYAPKDINLSFSEYSRLHYDIWSLYHSDVLRLHLQNEKVPLKEKYDNLEDVKCSCEYNGMPYPVGFTREMFKDTNPNNFSHIIRNSQRFEDSFYENQKNRRVTNTIYSQLYEDF